MNPYGHIHQAAEVFRRQYLAGSEHSLPVDVLWLAEICLQLNPIPIEGFREKFGADAAITKDALYIDAKAYDQCDDCEAWEKPRLRFSIAHELGHHVLHREEAQNFNPQTFDDFEDNYLENHYGSEKEREANEFAGRLLVPLEKLKMELDAYVEEIRPANQWWHFKEYLRANFAKRVAPLFGVHEKVILVRLIREELWDEQK
jgi:hypothetical protein